MQSGRDDKVPSTKKFDSTRKFEEDVTSSPQTYYSQDLKIRSFKFLVRENGGIVEVANRDTQLIVGRRGAMTHVDVDLADFEARELGVSRNHCMLDVQGDRVLLRDMESVNGTFINGQQLTPMQGYEISHGDEIKIGRMHLLVFFIGDDYEVLL